MLEVGTGLVATGAGDTVLGTAMGWAYGPAAGTIGMIIVAEEAQGRGLGRRLTTAIIERLSRPSLLLHATKIGRPLYTSLGFQPAGAIRQFQGVARAHYSSPNIRSLYDSERFAVCALDASVFGAPRHALIEKLWHSSKGSIAPDASGTPRGFALRRPFGLGQLIGPVVASSRQTAVELFEASLVNSFVRIDVDDDGDQLDAVLHQHGLECVGAAERMILGRWPQQRTDLRGYALASQAYG